jgi:hypothetical protein
MHARPSRNGRALGSRGRISAGVALVLLAQCSPERQVLFSAAEAGPPPDSSAGVGVGGSSAGVAGAIGTGGTVIGSGGMPCPAAGGCPAFCEHGFEVVMHLHGGCATCECGPHNDCNSDEDCPSGSVCFAGAQCDDACGEPECCSGNHCASPTCPAPGDVTCLAVGCPAGDLCLANCDSARCACDGTSWSCTYDAGAKTSCDSACTLP